ncbi:hypothetical protein IWX49DRAFT_107495 [Phyllosticta citricarpa]|uniref:Uncharacterized protein n=1 Tax=Phyllosticta citricarpa TaxID=55181 RepID=A0ABR1MEH5_9PEZI
MCIVDARKRNHSAHPSLHQHTLTGVRHFVLRHPPYPHVVSGFLIMATSALAPLLSNNVHHRPSCPSLSRRPSAITLPPRQSSSAVRAPLRGTHAAKPLSALRPYLLTYLLASCSHRSVYRSALNAKHENLVGWSPSVTQLRTQSVYIKPTDPFPISCLAIAVARLLGNASLVLCFFLHWACAPPVSPPSSIHIAPYLPTHVSLNRHNPAHSSHTFQFRHLGICPPTSLLACPPVSSTPSMTITINREPLPHHVLPCPALPCPAIRCNAIGRRPPRRECYRTCIRERERIGRHGEYEGGRGT